MKENWFYRRGDLYLANLGVPVGSQQGGVRPVVVLQNDVGNYYGQKSLPFLHTFDILEGSGVRHDNKSSNTQCMKIDEEDNIWLKEKSALLNFRNTEQ